MKYSIIIILFFVSCGYGQYPKSVINEKGKVYNINAQTKDTTHYEVFSFPISDSSMYYYEKFTYYIRLMNDSHGRKFARAQDSALKYRKLLLKYKK